MCVTVKGSCQHSDANFSLKIMSVHHRLSVAAGITVALRLSVEKSLCKIASLGKNG